MNRRLRVLLPASVMRSQWAFQLWLLKLPIASLAAAASAALKMAIALALAPAPAPMRALALSMALPMALALAHRATEPTSWLEQTLLNLALGSLLELAMRH